MNREIKFRAWDGVDYMSNLFTLSDLQNGKILFTSDTLVMQFTGLTDKNGVEIYESDVVKDKDGIIYAVEYRLCEFIKNDKSCSTNLHNSSSYLELEVIGNIHQHPTLLEK